MTRGDVFQAMTTTRVASSEQHCRLARAWIEGAVEQAIPTLWQRLNSESATLTTGTVGTGERWGEPHSLWCGLITTSQPNAGKRVTTYSHQRWEEFLKSLQSEPYRAEVELVRLDHEGLPSSAMARISVEGEVDHPEWKYFNAQVSDKLIDWHNSFGVQGRWISFVKEQANVQQSSFGNITNDNVEEQTALEMSLGLYADEAIVRSDHILRGYSWVTVLGKGLVQRLGGLSSLGVSNAFADVIPLGYGGCLLRATPAFDHYDEAAAFRVFKALAPILPAGRAEPVYGYEYLRLAYGVDAMDYR